MDPGTATLLSFLGVAVGTSVWVWVSGWLQTRGGRGHYSGERPLQRSGGTTDVDSVRHCMIGGLQAAIISMEDGGVQVRISGPDRALWMQTSPEGCLPQPGTGDIFFDQRWRIQNELHEALPFLSHNVRRALEGLARDPRVQYIYVGGGLLEAQLSPDLHGAQEDVLLRLAQVAGLLGTAPGAKRRLLEMARSDPHRKVRVEALIALASGPPSGEREEALWQARRSTSPDLALVAAVATGDASALGPISAEMKKKYVFLTPDQLSRIARLDLMGVDAATRRRLGLTLLGAPLSELVTLGLLVLRESCWRGDAQLGSALSAMPAPLTEWAKIELANTLELIGDLSAIPVLEAASRGLSIYGPTRARLTQAIEAIQARHAEELEARRAEMEGAIRLAPEASEGEIKVAHAESGAVKLAPREPDNSR